MRSLAAIVALFLLAAGPAAAEDARFDPEADFEAFWQLFDERYALFEVKGVDWDLVYRAYRPDVSEETSRAQLFAIFEEMTGLLNDVHVTVRDTGEGRFARSGGRSIGTGPFDIGVFSSPLIEQRYAAERLEPLAGGTMRMGRLRGGIGYLHIESFRYPTTTGAALLRIADEMEGCPAIIVDVRQNGGGSDAVARLIAALFADRSRVTMTAEERGSGEAGFGAPEPWRVEPREKALTRPVIVLTNDRTISAAENFTLMMRTFPHVTIIGQTTAGALADTYAFPIGSGWVFGVPINILRDAKGRSWEGIGVVPDLWARNTPEDITAGRDGVMELALKLASVSEPINAARTRR